MSFGAAVSVPVEAVVSTGRRLARLAVLAESGEGRGEESRAAGRRDGGRRSTSHKVPMRRGIVGGMAMGITAGREAAKRDGEIMPLNLQPSQVGAGAWGRRAGTAEDRPILTASTLPTAGRGVSAAGVATLLRADRLTKSHGHVPAMREAPLEMLAAGRRRGRGLAVLMSKSRRATFLCLAETPEAVHSLALVVLLASATESRPAPQGRRVS